MTREQKIAKNELQRRIRETTAGLFFGFELETIEPGRAVLKLRVRREHLQVYEVLHGGMIAALADTAGGLATYMSAPRGTRVATVEMKINFLEPVEKGTVRATARVLRLGQNLAVVDCDVRDPARLVAKALMTFAMRSGATGVAKKQGKYRRRPAKVISRAAGR
jgi:acyl-CoA thioesterase